VEVNARSIGNASNGLAHTINRRDIMKNARRMLMKMPLTTLLLFVAAATALAQDVVRVSPETHRVLLENAQARVLDVHVKPGEKVGMHSHPASILYYLTDAKLKITYPDGKTEERDVKAGTAVASDAVTHTAENIGATELHEVHTELKQTGKKAGPLKKEKPTK
jgi:beta-alanine degradation protein BauB